MVKASGLVAHAGCAEVDTSRESAPTWAKVDRRIPSPRRGHRGDQEFFQDRLQHNGTLGFFNHTKEKEERATKEKERANCLDLVSIHFGNRHLASELVPLCATAVYNGAECNRRGRATLEDGERSQRDQRTH